ncbi:MAG: polysaccharide biosynthesis protein [Bacteroidales bacterium]
MVNLELFISEFITKRPISLFEADLEANRELLGREIRGKSVMVIGGAGTIGSSYIRALLRFEPARLYVVDTSENGLTELTRDLRSTAGMKVPEVYRTYPLDFGDPLFGRIFRNEGPFDIVANFAAHKHVRSEKDAYSVAALLRNNVIKARGLLNLLSEAPPKHFFCVSTDKAANPVNIMGASKKLMEELIMAYAGRFPVTTARFANVAFSAGSLPDGWLNRLAKHQPLSAPSDVKRYFVSPEESGHICLMACILGQSGDIFFPRLEESQMMTFSEIGINLLRHLGYEPVVCGSEEEAKRTADGGQRTAERIIDGGHGLYPIYLFASDTSGEKAFEEFFTEGEAVDLERFTSLGVIKNAPIRPIEEVGRVVDELIGLLERPDLDKAAVVNALSAMLPGFSHIETGKSLDGRM